VSSELEQELGHSIFAFRGEKMEEIVGLRLSVGGYTIAVAESCTGGLIAERLTDVAGSSRYFIEGVVAYSNEAKTRTLGVEPILLLEHGAVSAPVAEAMAEGIRERAGTDFGLSVTGIAGPGGGTGEKPVGLVYIALASEVLTEHRKLMIPGDRHLIRWRASQAALDLLRRRLI
jgi:nicotinamide-nucleotide amidase